MKTLIWKEVRQNLVWALLALLAATLGALFAARQQQVAFTAYDALGSFGVNTLSIVALPVVGLLLGLCQTLSEARRDQWAYLVHRPVSRWRIFVAKAIAGLALYLLAGGLPLAGAWLWVATPNHVPAPFDPRLLLASGADLLAGAAWYFAALVVGAREARWYGSRIMPLGLAFIASCVAVLMPEFWMAAVGTGLLVACLAAAGWGSFIAGGAYRSQPLLARFTLGLSVAVGMTLLGALALGLLSELLPRGGQDYTFSAYQVTRDGQILKVTWRNNGFGPSSVTDLEGHPQPLPEQPRTWGTNWGDQKSQIVNPTFEMTLYAKNLPLLLRVPGYRSPSRYFPWVTQTWGARGQTHWYFSASRRVVLVYSGQTKGRLGTIGADGRLRAPGEPPAPPFLAASVERWGRWEWLTLTNSVWRPNPQARNLELVYSAESADPVEGVQWVGGQEFRGWLIRTHQSLRVLNEATKQWTVIPLSYGGPEYGELAIAFLPDSRDLVVVYRPNVRDAGSADRNPPAVFQRIAPDGRVLWTKTAPALTNPGMKYEPMTAETTVGLIIPPALAAAWAALLALMQPGSLSREWAAGATPMLLFSGLILLGAVISAVANWMLTRCYAMSPWHRINWVILGLVLGALSIVLFFALHELPARIACPSCGQKRVVNRDTCEHCASPFPPPPRKGTEIFSAPNPEIVQV